MAIFKRSKSSSDNDNSPDSIDTPTNIEKTSQSHEENLSKTTGTDSSPNFKVSKTGDGDVALALFSSPDDAKEAVDPLEEKKVVRKIDFMILPYLAVCYVFFYIDKTTLSYAAIFGIEDDLHLVGKQ